jgi:hypothetical protein
MSHRKDRERAEKGLLFRDGKLVDPKVADKMRSVGAAALKAMPTVNQIGVLANRLHSGKMSHDQLRKALEGGAPSEMRKGADKLIRQNKVLSVDALLEEYHNDKEFQALAAEVGLDESYFVNLAEQEIKKRLVDPVDEKRGGISGFLKRVVHSG